MTSTYMGQALLEKLSRSQLQQLAKKEGIKANSKSTIIIQELLRKHPEGIPRDGVPGESTKSAPMEIIQRKGKSRTRVRISPTILTEQGDQSLEPPSPKKALKRRKVDLSLERVESPESQTLPSPSVHISAQKEKTSERIIPITPRSEEICERASHDDLLQHSEAQPVPVVEYRQSPLSMKGKATIRIPPLISSGEETRERALHDGTMLQSNEAQPTLVAKCQQSPPSTQKENATPNISPVTPSSEGVEKRTSHTNFLQQSEALPIPIAKCHQYPPFMQEKNVTTSIPSLTSRSEETRETMSNDVAQLHSEAQSVELQQYPLCSERRQATPSRERPSYSPVTEHPPPSQYHRSPRKVLVPSGKEIRLIRRELTTMVNSWPEIIEQFSETQMVLDQAKQAVLAFEKGLGEMQHSVDFLEGFVGQYKKNQHVWDGSWKLQEKDRKRWKQYSKVNENLKRCGQGKISLMMADIQDTQKWEPEFWSKQVTEEDDGMSNEESGGEAMENIIWDGPGRLNNKTILPANRKRRHDD
ncbi:hypothetical protein BDQ17DRAFT_707822 [Cyathus striatus]|nr:hypothetical protein BDQ17DRAFT_707822 [Cyathus striatus]